MRIFATVQGASAIALKTQRLIQAARDGLKLGVSEAAFAVEQEAKQNVPVETGNLRDAIHTETVVDSPERQVLAVVPAYPAPNPWGIDPAYARRIEFGFIGADVLGRLFHQAAQPFMRTAYENTKVAAERTIRSSVTEQLASGH